MVVNNKTFRAKNVTWGYLANDNAFLNYGDAWFEQRTLIARFEMNETNTVETIRKPSINTIAMLSLLGDRRIPVRWETDGSGPTDMDAATAARHPSPQPATPYSTSYGAIAATRHGTPAAAGNGASSNRSNIHNASGSMLMETSVLLWNSNGTFNCTADCELTLNVTFPSGLPETAAVRVYRIDQQHGNPSGLWNNITGGDPMQHPYPSASTFEVCPQHAARSTHTHTHIHTHGIFGIGKCWKVVESAPLPHAATVCVHVCLPFVLSLSSPQMYTCGAFHLC